MTYCPSCRCECETGVMVCPGCGVTLLEAVSSLGGAAISPDRSWVVMSQVVSQLKSELAKGSLDSNNIPSVILSPGFNARGRNSGVGGSARSVGAEGTVILVPREFCEDASIVLEAVLGDDLIESR